MHIHVSKEIQTIIYWKKLTLVQYVRYFLDVANFYQIFIHNYSKVAAPLTSLAHKDKFKWNEEADQTFEILKNVFTTTAIFMHHYLQEPIFLKSNYPNSFLGALLSQPDIDVCIYSVVIYSHKFIATKINYKIHNNEFLIIVNLIQKWCQFFWRS